MNTKQTIFVNEYLKCWNASEAARRAGYNGKSNVYGPTLLANLSIKAEIRRRMDEMTLSADEVLAGLSEQATVSIADFLKPNSLEIDPVKVHEKGHLIKSLSWTQYGPKIELYDNQAAKVHIGKVHGMFTENFKVSDWRTELIEAIKQGKIKVEDIPTVLGDNELAREFIESSGLQFAGIRENQTATTEVNLDA